MVPFGKKSSYILLPLSSLELLAVEYLRETSISNFIYYLYLFYIYYLFFRCLEKLFEEGRNETKKAKSRGLTANYIQ